MQYQSCSMYVNHCLNKWVKNKRGRQTRDGRRRRSRQQQHLSPLTLRGSTVVMMVASMNGLGLLAVSSMRLCHWRGRPTNFCSCSSKSVCTRCSKLEGAEIWIRDFFFLANMMVLSGHHTCTVFWETATNNATYK